MTPSPLARWGPPVIFLAVAGFGLTSMIPTGPATPENGRIAALERNWRNGVYTVIHLPDGQSVHAPPNGRHDCAVGDAIELTRQPRLWTTTFSPANRPPCSA